MYPIPQTETLVETKTCKHCRVDFPITDQDLEFYDKVSPVFAGVKCDIPAPTLCPDCRQQRRLSFRNERKLYKRKCDATGRDIISIYSPDKPFKVYHQDEWWSDKWDPLDYGCDFDFGRPFFEQFGELVGGVPRMALCYSSCENSSFCNQVADCKDSYLIVSCSEAQNCMYGKRMNNSQYCVDCLLTIGSEHCYECIDCHNCHDCLHCRNIENGRNLRYCLDCIGCSDCWFCVGLQNASFSILNKGYSKEEFERKISQMLREGIDNYAEAFKNLNDSYPKKYLDLLQVEETVGDHVFQSKESFFVFDAGNVQNVRYSQFVNDTKDSADIDYGCCVSGRSYEIVAGWLQMDLCLFGTDVWPNVQSLTYCDSCSSSSHLFGCVGLRNKEYCVFNKQYSKEEYEALVPRIIEHMEKTGEWGEFFPSSISPFGYNETVAQEYHPLTREQVLGKGAEGIFHWSDYEPPFPKVEKTIPASKLPENIAEVPDDILNWAIECEATKKPFRIIAQELEFYRKHNLPIPRRHPDQRHLDRMALRNPRKLFERVCDCPDCAKNNAAPDGEPVKFLTTYALDRTETVYCETCYAKEVLG